MQPEPKQCPQCGEEFLATVETCSDCRVPLRPASELADAAGSGLPPASDLVLIRAEGPAWIEELADRLRADEVPSRVEIIDPARYGVKSGMSGSACGLFVRAQDEARAREIDALVQQEQIPDLPAAAAAAAGGEAESEGCPACGHVAAADASECPDCGLFFG